MAKQQLNLIYALKNEKAVHISEVESGLNCDCICPACGEQLVAKKGSKMMHHFAHRAGHNCEYGYESSLHLAAKDIISKCKKFTIPAVYFDFPGSHKKDMVLFPEKEIEVEKVELEKRYDGIIPDIVIRSGGKELFVEIFVTHRIDELKLKKLKEANISTIEINLSKYKESLTAEELTTILINDNDKKIWKYNAIIPKYTKRFYGVSDKRKIIKRGFALHVDNCPIGVRMYRGKPYANYLDNCLDCEYCISSNGETEIFCSGRLRIATLADFEIPEEQRIKDSNDRIDDLRESAFMAGNCPNCGHTLVRRQSQYGEFIGCSNYPHCRFMGSIDPETGAIKMKS